jgi:hypothetical protein
MSKLVEYSLYLYFRQGDDFRHYLDECEGNVSDALVSMSKDLYAAYNSCVTLSKMMKGMDIIAHASGHHISFEPGNDMAIGLMEVLVKEKVLNQYELEEEEYGYDDNYDDDDNNDDDDDDDDDADD